MPLKYLRTLLVKRKLVGIIRVDFTSAKVHSGNLSWMRETKSSIYMQSVEPNLKKRKRLCGLFCRLKKESSFIPWNNYFSIQPTTLQLRSAVLSAVSTWAHMPMHMISVMWVYLIPLVRIHRRIHSTQIRFYPTHCSSLANVRLCALCAVERVHRWCSNDAIYFHCVKHYVHCDQVASIWTPFHECFFLSRCSSVNSTLTFIFAFTFCECHGYKPKCVLMSTIYTSCRPNAMDIGHIWNVVSPLQGNFKAVTLMQKKPQAKNSISNKQQQKRVKILFVYNTFHMRTLAAATNESHPFRASNATQTHQLRQHISENVALHRHKNAERSKIEPKFFFAHWIDAGCLTKSLNLHHRHSISLQKFNRIIRYIFFAFWLWISYRQYY